MKMVKVEISVLIEDELASTVEQTLADILLEQDSNGQLIGWEMWATEKTGERDYDDSARW